MCYHFLSNNTYSNSKLLFTFINFISTTAQESRAFTGLNDCATTAERWLAFRYHPKYNHQIHREKQQMLVLTTSGWLLEHSILNTDTINSSSAKINSLMYLMSFLYWTLGNHFGEIYYTYERYGPQIMTLLRLNGIYWTFTFLLLGTWGWVREDFSKLVYYQLFGF